MSEREKDYQKLNALAVMERWSEISGFNHEPRQYGYDWIVYARNKNGLGPPTYDDCSWYETLLLAMRSPEDFQIWRAKARLVGFGGEEEWKKVGS